MVLRVFLSMGGREDRLAGRGALSAGGLSYRTLNRGAGLSGVGKGLLENLGEIDPIAIGGSDLNELKVTPDYYPGDKTARIQK